jgi:hypothetical protein
MAKLLHNSNEKGILWASKQVNQNQMVLTMGLNY